MSAWFVATLAVTPANTPTNRFITLQDNPGGSVDAFKKAKTDLIRINASIHFKGWCASACTMLLNIPGSCVYPGAKLLYHPMYSIIKLTSGKTIKVILPFDDQVDLLSELPPKLRTYLIQNHMDVAMGLEDKNIILDATQFVKTCDNVGKPI